MKQFSRAVAALAALCGAHAASAACTTAIETVPYVISAPGSYCLRHSVKLTTQGAAVEIKSSNVVLDLLGFSIVSGIQDVHQYTTGVHSAGYNTITVRNGRIRGFRTGVDLSSDIRNAGNYLVERLTVRSTNYVGIQILGGGSTIQDNVISDTAARAVPSTFVIALQIDGAGGTTTVHNNRIDNTLGSGTSAPTPAGNPGIGAEGIIILDAPGASIVDNTITDTTAGPDIALGIVYMCAPKSGVVCTAAMASSNEILNSAAAPGAVGFTIAGSSGGGGGVLNMAYSDIENFREGIKYIDGTGNYRASLVAGAATPFNGGRAVGVNETEP